MVTGLVDFLSKEIMKHNKLRNRFLKDRTKENRNRNASQRNYCVSLLKKTNNEYFCHLNEKYSCDNKMFLKTVKPFLSDKVVFKEQIALVENNEIISEGSDVGQSSNSFFPKIVKNLKDLA